MSAVGLSAFAVRPEQAGARASGERIPSRLRRGASELVRTFADLYSALEPSLTDPAPLLVTGSAYGETETAIALIRAELDDPATVSPARFAGSVHNTAAGLLAIATGNTSAATSIAAGPLTFAMALVEAMALVRTTGRETVVLVAEQSLPSDFASALVFDTVGVGLVLAPPGGPCLARLDEAHGVAAIRGEPVANRPPWYPSTFVEALRSGKNGVVELVNDGGRAIAIRIEPA